MQGTDAARQCFAVGKLDRHAVPFPTSQRIEWAMKTSAMGPNTLDRTWIFQEGAGIGELGIDFRLRVNPQAALAKTADSCCLRR